MRRLLSVADSRLLRATIRQKVHDRHADGDAVGDLFKDEGAGSVCDGGGELNVAINGTGMKYGNVPGYMGEASLVDAEKSDVFTQAGEESGLLTFELHA